MRRMVDFIEDEAYLGMIIDDNKLSSSARLNVERAAEKVADMLTSWEVKNVSRLIRKRMTT